MFASFTVLLVYITVLYKVYEDIEPDLNWIVDVISLVGLALLAITWRALLLRRTLPLAALRFVDVFYAVGTSTIFGASAVLAYDLHSSAWICLVSTCLMVLLRAVIVPSTGRRTLRIGIASCLPLTLATVIISYLEPQEIPGPAYVSGGALICIGSILLAAISSDISHGLRRDMAAAMQLGQYTLVGKIGEGGMGAVYRAQHALLRRPTAIKLLKPERVDPDMLDRFEREVQHMSQLTHPNTVAVYDYGRSPEGVFYYAMEYLDGIDLEQLVARFGAQPSDRVTALLIQICGALQEAHGRGLIHRDIKPANIIVCQRGDVPDVAKVVDFGLVHEIAARDGNARRAVLGTPAYVAPEAITDPDRVGPAADLYALGAVGYFLLSGRRVFDGKTDVEVCVQHAKDAPVPLSQHVTVAPALERAIMTCLAKRPEDRPASAAALAKELRALAAADDWSEDRARAWWHALSSAQPRTLAHTPSRTITIDLGGRLAQDVRAIAGSFGGRGPCNVAPSTGV